jgi:hypothetical protein
MGLRGSCDWSCAASKVINAFGPSTLFEPLPADDEAEALPVAGVAVVKMELSEVIESPFMGRR